MTAVCKYTFDSEVDLEKGFTDENLADNQGLCDALFLGSLKRGDKCAAHKGDLEFIFTSYDFQVPGGDRMLNTEMFMMWSTLAFDMYEDEELPEWQRTILKRAFDDVRHYLLNPTPDIAPQEMLES